MPPPQWAVAFEPGAASRLGGYVYFEIAGTLRAQAGDNQLAVVYEVRNDIPKD